MRDDRATARPSPAMELFQGRLRPELFLPFPLQDEHASPEGEAFLERLEAVLREHVDPEEIDRTGEIPDLAIEALAGIGAFGIKIPREHGGLGLGQVDYSRVAVRLASWCANTTALLSAHQSIGVPQPLALFGTEEQKARWFPRLAAGALSGFALTEAEAGSDPANMSTTATRSPDGDGWILDGEKLWCTNGTRADLFVVVARTPDREVRGRVRRQYTAFVVERDMPGVQVLHRCHFMGLRALYAGVVRFDRVRVPDDHVLLGEGRGLKVALTTLNAGRLTLPSACVGGSKWCLREARRFAAEREQWGGPIGAHEAVAHKLAWIASHTFAQEAAVFLTAHLVDRGDTDIRVEAATCKMFGSETLWRIVNETLQIRSGRGFETSASLRERGERGVPVERLLRDARINMIFEGTSEIMRLFLAREALSPHLRRLRGLAADDTAGRVRAASQAGLHYARWYPGLYLPSVAGLEVHPRLRPHLAWARAVSRRLSRALVHAVVRHGAGLEKRQALLARLVEIGTDLFVTAATCARADALHRRGGDEADAPLDLAEVFAGHARERVESRFAALGRNQDAAAWRLAQDVLAGDHAWLERGAVEGD